MRKIYALMVLLFAVLQLPAQVLVQGRPHPTAKPQMVSPRAIADGTFTMDMIENWSGEGANRAAFVVQWNAESETSALVWGFRWDGEATGETMARAIAASDPRFFIMTETGTAYGSTVSGFGYDVNKSGDFSITKDGVTLSPDENGVIFSSSYGYDGWTCTDPEDYWQSGWYQGYWSYWLKSNDSDAWGYSGTGITGRKLTDGCWDGWNFSVNMSPQSWKPLAPAPKNGPTAPSVKVQPEDVTVSPGESVTFAPEFKGDSLYFQWYKDEVAIQDAEASSYSIVSAETSDAGRYYCVVSNMLDTISTDTVTLVVGGDTTYPKSNATGQFTATPNNFKKWECVDKEDHWNSPSVSEDGVWHCLARSESGNEAETEINKMPIQNRYTYIFYYDKPGSDTPDYANAVAVEPYIQEAVDYSQGIFFVNEDWYGWDNGTINFLTNDGRMLYRVFRRENPDEKLGVTTQFGTIYGEKFFLISKQAKSTEEESTGGRLVVADALSLEKIAAFDQIGGGDGRSFLGVDEKTGYIGSSSGIFVFDIENMKVGDVIEGTSNDEGLYSGQIGSMVRAGKYVFAAKQSEGVLVIDAENHTLQTTIELPSIATLVLGRDGNIWAADGNALVRINPVSFETWTRSLPSGCRVADTWGAWNAGSLCAAYKSNLLYFADESKNKVVRYNIDTDELNASFFTLPDQDGEYVQMFYGAGLRVDPQTDNVVVTSTESGYLSHYMNNWIHIVDGTNGELLNTLLPEKYYWFPAMPVFPDNEYPVISISDNLSVGSFPVKISLLESVSDADNLSAAIVSTVKVEDPSILSARIEGYDLILSGEKLGDTSFTLAVNSNGRVETKMVSVHVTEVSGIEEAESLKIVASPNPVRDILTVRACVGAELTVFDLRGVAVYRDTMVESESRLNVSSLPAGIYVLSVCANDRTEYIRIIKQ